MPFAIMAVALLIAYLALFPALAVLIFSWITRCLRARMPQTWHSLIYPIVWANVLTLSEWLRAVLLSGFPWLSPGYAQALANQGLMSWLSLANWAPWVGWLGLTWLSLALSAFIAEILMVGQKSSRGGAMVGLMGLIASSLALPYFSPQWTVPSATAQRFVLVQGNLDIAMKWNEERYAHNLRHYLALLADELIAERDESIPTTIVFPETALTLFDHPLSVAFIDHLVKSNRSLIIGGIGRNDQGYTNSAQFFQPQQPMQSYQKTHLVPFGEFSPPAFAWFAQKLAIPMANLQAGKRDQPLWTMGEGRAQVSICYENLFPEEMAIAPANLLINLSNTGWYGDSWAMPQHLQISQMRAMESAKPLLHVADTGISAVIQADGKITAQQSALTAGLIRQSVYPHMGNTPYSRWGNLILALWMIGSTFLILMGVGFAHRHRHRHRHQRVD